MKRSISLHSILLELRKQNYVFLTVFPECSWFVPYHHQYYMTLNEILAQDYDFVQVKTDFELFHEYYIAFKLEAYPSREEATRRSLELNEIRPIVIGGSFWQSLIISPKGEVYAARY